MLLLLLTICVYCVSSHQMLDMTHIFDNRSLHWPSGQAGYGYKLTILMDQLTAGGYWYQSDKLNSGTHLGTHLDAPCHFSQYGWCVADIPIDRLMWVPAVRIDIREKASQIANSNVTLGDVKEYEKLHGNIPRGAVVFMCSGWSDRYPDKAAVWGNNVDDTSDFHFPGFALDATEFLVDKRSIVGIAVDTPSTDYGQSKSFPTHVFAGDHNIYGLENVKDTCSLPPRGATVVVAPSKLADSSGAATRIFASWGLVQNNPVSINGGNEEYSNLIAMVTMLISTLYV